MLPHSFPRILVALILVILAAHVTALHYSLYWTIRWIDIPMHILGGFWIGGTALWLLYFYKVRQGRTLKGAIFFAVVAAIVIGIAWELFEFITNSLSTKDPFDVLDTAGDLLCDTLGGICAGWYIWITSKEII